MSRASLQGVKAKAAEINARLRADMFHCDERVYVRQDDGMCAHFASAFALAHEGWYLVFSEHFEPQVFPADEVEEIYEYAIGRGNEGILATKDWVPAMRRRDSDLE
jgi:hypothetical protein